MEIKQINLKVSKDLHSAAENYAKNFGFKNVQELIAESIREKVFENNRYDETFSETEIKLIDRLIDTSVRKNKIISEEELNKVLAN